MVAILGVVHRRNRSRGTANRGTAPNIAGDTLDGKPLSLTGLRGHIVVLNVWGSWCSHCREEGAALEETYQKYQPKGVDFLGINAADNNAAAQAYVRAAGIAYPSLQDPDETLVLQFKSTLLATSVLSTVILDQEGRAAVRVIGEATGPELVQ